MPVKLLVRKSRPIVPAQSHRPGRGRPQTRHSVASGCVSRPQRGQRIAPVGLRNICATIGFGVMTFGEAITLVEPAPEVDQPTGQRAEGALRIARPLRTSAARGATDATVARRRIITISHASGHDAAIVLIALEEC